MNITNSNLKNVGFSNYVSIFESHKHDVAQLSYTIEGILRTEIDNKMFIIPPNMAIFIPPNHEHKIGMQKTIKIENLYFDNNYINNLPTKTQLIAISELAKQVIFKICSLGIDNKDSPLTKSLFTILLEEINSSIHLDYAIRIPTDPKLLKVYSLFNNCQDKFPQLEEAAECACVNIRTLTRLFIKDTGLNFVTWKQQFMFIRSLELLQQYKQTTLVAYQLGYNSESAFINMFKKMSGGKVPSDFWRKS
jgi:AraC-like DNA-binding protein